ncbi:MAG: antibiotic biosynthesis monooxygenase family protein [Gemmatimonadota bacterium]
MTQCTRSVQFEIKPGKGQEFKTTMEKEILPLMKRQEGFRGELAMVNDDRGIGISLWDNREHAEEYRTNTYPKVLETLKPVIQGTPSVESFDLAVTTLRS